jgi:hypothetical protein
MSTNQKTNRLEQQANDQALINGLKKHQSTLPSVLVGGTALPTATVIAALQARIDAANAIVATKATWQAAVAGAREEQAKSGALLLKVRQALQLAFDGNVDTLADFGLAPRKPRVVSTTTKVAAATKAKATRAARHTMGTEQKKAVKGDVTGVVVTPVTATKADMPSASTPTAPASPAPATNPAPSGTSPAPVANPGR